mgnify:CR=1 FL=1
MDDNTDAHTQPDDQRNAQRDHHRNADAHPNALTDNPTRKPPDTWLIAAGR